MIIPCLLYLLRHKNYGLMHKKISKTFIIYSLRLRSNSKLNVLAEEARTQYLIYVEPFSTIFANSKQYCTLIIVINS